MRGKGTHGTQGARISRFAPVWTRPSRLLDIGRIIVRLLRTSLSGSSKSAETYRV